MKGHQCQESKVYWQGGVPLILQDDEYKLKLPDKLTVPVSCYLYVELRHKNYAAL